MADVISPVRSERILSLDILRGFDIFCLVALGPILVKLVYVLGWQGNSYSNHLFHVDWVGLHAWDMVMPLFIFMAGVSIPLAVANHRKKNWGDAQLWLRLIRRFAILWLLGMVCQGNLLGLNVDRIFLFTNTLQSIAVGALITTPIIMYTSRFRTRLTIMFGLMIAFSCIMNFITVEGITAGSYAKFNNLPEWIDRAILGRFVDGARMENGNVIFSHHYNYAWILGSLNMAALTLAGALGGSILQSSDEKMQKLKKMGTLIAVFFLAYFIFEGPCIKKLFTSSFTALSAGISLTLLAIFYFLIDIKGKICGLGFLRIYGSNAIMAYMLFSIFPAGMTSRVLFYGLAQFTGNYFQLVLTIADAAILFIILWILNRANIYVRA